MRSTNHSPSAAARQHQPVAAMLLDWYDAHHRDLPWRVPPHAAGSNALPDPYRVWLSEIMLQQTTVEAVKPYFARFVETWPSVRALAAADPDDIMKAWAGLGYYSRARNLKKCADTVVRDHHGQFPDTEARLLALPGIGPYTAAAIAAIAFDRPATVIDGNVERVAARLFAIDTPLPAARPQIRDAVGRLVPDMRPGDFAQGMMDFGATICTPRKPACILCPVRTECAALASGDPERLPIKAPKADRPLRRGAAFVAVRGDGAILLRRRAETGLLGGMSEVPTTGWTARRDGETGIKAAPFPANWRKAGEISHVFTHFSLQLTVYIADVKDTAEPLDGWWSPRKKVRGEALPTVMKKVIEAAIPGATKRSGQPGPEQT